MTFYSNQHYSQYAATQAIVRSQGCNPTTGSNGADASTGGKVKQGPDAVWNLIPESQQSNPASPGWSMTDLDKAMAKLNVPFTNRTGEPWTKVLSYIQQGHYLALSGDCDQLGGCTGFLGNHTLGVHPFHHSTKGQRCNEPTRADYNYYSLDKLKNYAVKFSGSVNSIVFGTFDLVVPQLGANMAKFVQANGYGVGSGKLLTVPAGSEWRYLDETPGGKFLVPTTVNVYGLIDAHKNDYLAGISTGAPYSDGSPRTTLVFITSAVPLTNVPTIPPVNDLKTRQQQWDSDATAVVGPRPVV